MDLKNNSQISINEKSIIFFMIVFISHKIRQRPLPLHYVLMIELLAMWITLFTSPIQCGFRVDKGKIMLKKWISEHWMHIGLMASL